MDKQREIALKAIYDILEKEAFSNITVNHYLEGSDLNQTQRGFVTDLIYGTVKWKKTLDYVISLYSKIRLKKISPWIINILRLGIYQLLYNEKIPVSAACNESVNLAKKFGHSASAGFVNGLLRNVARNRQTIEWPDKNRSIKDYLAVRYSHPDWMVENWLEIFGAKFTEELLAANCRPPELTVRANTLKCTPSELIENLKSEGVNCRPGEKHPYAVVIESTVPIFSLNSFKEGLFQVQDESSMLVAGVLDPQPGDLVIDVCCAPGGKTTHIAQLMLNRGKISARDIFQHKLNLVNESAKRLGINIIDTQIHDATNLDESLKFKADRVLVDAPCSGLGIIRRKPDIKWSRESRDKESLVKLQTEILRTSSCYVKPGGFMVYSTCTIEAEENENMIKSFVLGNTDFELVDFRSKLPDGIDKPTVKEGYLQLYPNIDNCDGFFISLFKRKA